MAALNDILVLNAEIAALVRAGIPLELGLRRLSESVSGRLGALAERLAVRLESGQTLVAAIREEQWTVSPMYAAVIEAALAADRLPEALDGLVLFGRTLQETRRQIGLALLYPTIVAIAAYGLFVLFALVVVPEVVVRWDPLSPFRAWFLPVCESIQASAVCWVPAVPAVVVAGLVLASKYGRARTDTEFVALEPGGRGLLTGTWIPGVPQLYRDLDRAHTSQVLGFLLEQGVPMPNALRLVSQMTGSQSLAAAYSRLAEGAELGRALASDVHFEPRLPTLIAQLLRAGAVDKALPDSLRKASEIYYRRVRRRVAWMRSTLSPVFAVAIGGTVTVAFTLALGFPLRWLIHELFQFV